MKQKNKGKELTISIKGDILSVTKEYLKASNTDETEMGYLFGSIEKGNPAIRERLTNLTQIFFFAGIFADK